VKTVARADQLRIRDRKLAAAFCATLLLSGTAFAVDSPSAWSGSPVGECVSNYTVPKPSADYPVTVQKVKGSDAQKNSYVWIWDPTTEKNPTRQLVRITPGKVGCTVLFLPFSESNDFKLTASGNLPEKVTSTMATVNDERGSYFFEHAYRLDRRSGYYEKTPTCYKRNAAGGQREKVSCEASVE
jgi:hypothetical protein